MKLKKFSSGFAVLIALLMATLGLTGVAGDVPPDCSYLWEGDGIGPVTSDVCSPGWTQRTYGGVSMFEGKVVGGSDDGVTYAQTNDPVTYNGGWAIRTKEIQSPFDIEVRTRYTPDSSIGGGYIPLRYYDGCYLYETWMTPTSLQIHYTDPVTVIPINDNDFHTINYISHQMGKMTVLFDGYDVGTFDTPRSDGYEWTRPYNEPGMLMLLTGLSSTGSGQMDYIKLNAGTETEPVIKDPATCDLPIEASVDIKPDTLNLKSNGRWVTAFIALPDGYDVNDIDVGTVLLEGTVPAAWGKVQDGVLMAKFDREDVQDLVSPGEVTLKVTGELSDGTVFEGSDTIRVINPGK